MAQNLAMNTWVEDLATDVGVTHVATHWGETTAVGAKMVNDFTSKKSNAYICNTPSSQVSTAPCTPILLPTLLDPRFSIGDVREANVGVQPTEQEPLGLILSQAWDPMPDTDDEFESPFPTPVQYAFMPPLQLMVPLMLSDQKNGFVAPPLPSDVQREAPPFEDIVMPKDTFAPDEEDETDVDFFRSISFSEFMAAYKPTPWDSASLERSASERLAVNLASKREIALCHSAFEAWSALRRKVASSESFESNLEIEESQN
jgi:hypothetical protein